MTDTISGHVEVDGGTLYYKTAGEGEALVLSHAAFLDSRMFDAQWEVLAQHFRVIAYDMLGYGQSSVVSGPVCRRDHLRRLLSHLDMEQAHLVGCSNGGELMLDLTLEQPELALSLTLVGATPGGFEMQGAPPRYVLEMFDALQKGDVEWANELQIRIWLDSAFREPDTMDSVLRERALTMNRIPVERRTFLIADMETVCPLDPPAIVRLHEVRCPVLLVVGSLDNSEVVRAAEVMAEQMTNTRNHARKQIMDATGHVPSFEQPEVFNRLLLDFLLDA